MARPGWDFSDDFVPVSCHGGDFGAKGRPESRDGVGRLGNAFYVDGDDLWD